MAGHLAFILLLCPHPYLQLDFFQISPFFQPWALQGSCPTPTGSSRGYPPVYLSQPASHANPLLLAIDWFRKEYVIKFWPMRQKSKSARRVSGKGSPAPKRQKIVHLDIVRAAQEAGTFYQPQGKLHIEVGQSKESHRNRPGSSSWAADNVNWLISLAFKPLTCYLQLRALHGTGAFQNFRQNFISIIC